MSIQLYLHYMRWSHCFEQGNIPRGEWYWSISVGVVWHAQCTTNRKCAKNIIYTRCEQPIIEWSRRVISAVTDDERWCYDWWMWIVIASNDLYCCLLPPLLRTCRSRSPIKTMVWLKRSVLNCWHKNCTKFGWLDFFIFYVVSKIVDNSFAATSRWTTDNELIMDSRALISSW